MKARVAILALLLVLGARVWWRVETEAPIGGPVAEVTIAQGATTRAVAEKLAAAGLVKRPWSFALLVRLRGDEARIKAGRYRFEGPYSLLDIERKLVAADPGNATARRDLAERQAGAAAAEQRAEVARAVLAAETGAAVMDFADSLAAWLPRAQATRDHREGEARLAGQAVEAARGALAANRARERAVEWLMEKRAADARAAALRAEQAALDEAAQRRR